MGRVLGDLSGWGGACDNDVRLEAQTFSSEGGKQLAAAISREIVNGDGPPVDIAQVAQALEERIESCRPRCIRIECKKAQPRDCLGLLCIRRQRPSRHAEDGNDQLAPSHGQRLRTAAKHAHL